MPRSKNPDKYPSVFKDLLLAAYAAGETGITWKCPDSGTAHRTRFQLYAYINALEKQELNMAMPDELREAPRFHQIQITIAKLPDGTAIKLLNRNFTPENMAIQAALAVLGPLDPDTPEDKEAQAEAKAIIDAFEADQIEAGHDKPAELDKIPEGDLSSLFTKP